MLIQIPLKIMVGLDLYELWTDLCIIVYRPRRGPSKDAPFFYMQYYCNELQSCKSIISDDFFSFSHLNSKGHNLVIGLCCELKNQLKMFL